jgi:hypothetical protein
MILRAPAKEPDDRFQTAGEMVRALNAAVRAEPAARAESAVVEMAGSPAGRARAVAGIVSFIQL